MKQYGSRFTYFVSLLVLGYLFWGRRIYIHWPIKWPLGIFNGGAAWSLLALANVCLCVIEYFMGSSKFSAQTISISGFTIFFPLFIFFQKRKPFENMYSTHCVKLTLMFVLRLFIFRICLSYAFICWLFLFQLTFTLYPNMLVGLPTSFFHSPYECSRCITSIQVEIASLSFLFFSEDGLISASLLFEWPVYE